MHAYAGPCTNNAQPNITLAELSTVQTSEVWACAVLYIDRNWPRSVKKDLRV